MKLNFFRLFSLAVGICGIVFYIFWLWISWLEWRQSDFILKAQTEQFRFVVDSIFISGLPPLLLAIHFLIIKKSVSANRAGIIYIMLFIPIHIYVSVATAHSASYHILAQIIELLGAILLIWFWKEKLT